MKSLFKLIKRLCTFQIIMAKTTLKSIEVMENLDDMEKGFKDKLQKANEKQ